MAAEYLRLRPRDFVERVPVDHTEDDYRSRMHAEDRAMGARGWAEREREWNSAEPQAPGRPMRRLLDGTWVPR